jgi:hypothetical protein
MASELGTTIPVLRRLLAEAGISRPPQRVMTARHRRRATDQRLTVRAAQLGLQLLSATWPTGWSSGAGRSCGSPTNSALTCGRCGIGCGGWISTVGTRASCRPLAAAPCRLLALRVACTMSARRCCRAATTAVGRSRVRNLVGVGADPEFADRQCDVRGMGGRLAGHPGRARRREVVEALGCVGVVGPRAGVGIRRPFPGGPLRVRTATEPARRCLPRDQPASRARRRWFSQPVIQDSRAARTLRPSPRAAAHRLAFYDACHHLLPREGSVV